MREKKTQPDEQPSLLCFNTATKRTLSYVPDTTCKPSVIFSTHRERAREKERESASENKGVGGEGKRSGKSERDRDGEETRENER